MRRTRLWFVALATIFQGSFATPSFAGYREDSFKKLVDYMRTSGATSNQVRVSDLHKSFLNTTLKQDKKIVSLSLGVHYLESNPRLALQYLTVAKLACEDKDPLSPMLTYYLGVAKLKTGNPQQALNLATQITNQDVPHSLRKLALILGVEASSALEDYDQLHSFFDTLTARFSLGRRLEHIAQKGALALEKKGESARAYELTEDLARAYPNTPGSRWAFRRLTELHCEGSKTKPQHAYSLQFLNQLARNITPDNGLEDFILQAVQSPLRLENGDLRRLRPEEHIHFLISAQLFKPALQALSERYQAEKRDPESQLAPLYLLDLGRTELKLNEPYKAAGFFSKYLLDYPAHYLAPRAVEFLGDSLRYAGFSREAEKTYADALSKKESRLLRWYHFWMVYRSGDYAQAKAIIERKNYLEPREGDDLISLEYWHGRILEKLGEKAASDTIFRSILANAGNTFYAAAIATKYPHLIPRPSSESEKETPPSKGATLAAKMLPSPTNFSDLKPPSLQDVVYVKDLIRGGLNDVAAMHLQNLDWGKITDTDSVAALSRLAYMIGDYNPSKRTQNRLVTALQTIPRDYGLLLKHQQAHNNEWKLFYPVAYEKIVFPVAKGIKISPYLILAIMRGESFYKKDAQSPVGAYGLMQLMPYTAIKIANLLHDEEFNILELAQPEINISYGAYYLDRLVRYYSGNPYVAVAAYNAGPKAVSQWIGSCAQCEPDEFVESIPFRETRRYVREVMRNYVQYSRIYLNKSEPLPLPAMPARLPDDEIF